MNVVDSSAWLSYFAGDKNAHAFASAIENLEELLVPSITITEVFNNVLRQCASTMCFNNVLRQRDEESALAAIAHIKHGRVIPLDSALAIDAGNYGVIHKLPLADSIIFATAQKYNGVVWTQDIDFKGLPNVKYFATKST